MFGGPSKTMKPTLPPPEGYATWLDYAVKGMDTRSLYLDLCVEGRSEVSREDMRAAVEQELRELRAAAGVPDTYRGIS